MLRLAMKIKYLIRILPKPTNFHGASALVYLHLSFSATKRCNSCAAGVRPDAPLFYHDF